MSIFYPYEWATSENIYTLSNKIFTSSGTIRKNAENACRRLASKYNLEYNDVWSAVKKNYNFYWNSYKQNNPKATNAEILEAQNRAFQNSLYNRIAKQGSIEYLANVDEYVWLPSSSDNPRDSHELRYGKTFSKDNPADSFPAEEPHCQCGIKVIKYAK